MNTTAWVVVAVILALIMWDIFASFHWGYTGTISYDTLNTSMKHPLIPFLVGIVAGHLFWPQ